MAKILEMPKLSPTMEEGVLSAWHKKEGDPIAVDDLLADVETDKATMEFRSFDKATLLKILVAPGTQVKLGQPVAIIGAPGEDIAALVGSAGPDAGPTAAAPQPPPAAAMAPAAQETPAAPPSPPAAAPPPVGAALAPGPAVKTPEPPAPDTTPPIAQRKPPVTHALERASFPGERAQQPAGDGRDGGERVLASPYVRKVAREQGIDLKGAHGSGPGGRVVPGDLEGLHAASAANVQAANTQAATAITRPGTTATPATLTPPAALAPPEARPLSPMRRTIARRLVESKTTVPHFYLSIDVDAAELVKLRTRVNDEMRAKGTNADGEAGATDAIKVSLNDLLVKACAIALVRVPECNASFSADAILVHRRVDISVAVAVPDGLVTPVVRNADQKSVAAIAREVRDLAGRARARKLKPEEMADGTFSISNLGMFGIDQFAAVINPPEGAILAVGQVRDVPVVVDGAVVAGQRLALTLSCDHRVVDGAVGAAFLAELRRLLEHPLRVLTG
jgi:pyruvate dehydrogenase E2 component (dihydrolipoamide acetyltransferase)